MRVLTRAVVLLVAGSMLGGGLMLLAGIGCTIPLRKPKPAPPNKQSAARGYAPASHRLESSDSNPPTFTPPRV